MKWPARPSFIQLPQKPEVPEITGLLSFSRRQTNATLITDEPRESAFLLQQLSIALQKGNAVVECPLWLNQSGELSLPSTRGR